MEVTEFTFSLSMQLFSLENWTLISHNILTLLSLADPTGWTTHCSCPTVILPKLLNTHPSCYTLTDRSGTVRLDNDFLYWDTCEKTDSAPERFKMGYFGSKHKPLFCFDSTDIQKNAH